jgi:hypothetical protein
VSSDRWKEVLFAGATPMKRKRARMLHEITVPASGKLPARVVAIGEMPEEENAEQAKLDDPNCRGEWQVNIAVASCTPARGLRIGRASGEGLRLAGLDGTPRLVEIAPGRHALELKTTVRAECKPTRHLTDVTWIDVGTDGAKMMFSDQIDMVEDMTGEGQEKRARHRTMQVTDLDGDGVKEIVITGEEELCDNAKALREGKCEKKPMRKTVWKLQGERYAEVVGSDFTDTKPGKGPPAKGELMPSGTPGK